MDHLKSLEIELHQQAVRKDTNRITELLHPDFIEVGYSGNTYDFNSTLSGISSLPPKFVIWSQDYEFVEYAEDVVQVIYLSANVDEEGNLFRHAKRTSIWVKEGDNWQMKYHQGIPVAPFEKSNA